MTERATNLLDVYQVARDGRASGADGGRLGRGHAVRFRFRQPGH
ncbi:MAG: hypothetical protein ACRD0A_19580 [Acidimicrobiales bacterium]